MRRTPQSKAGLVGAMVAGVVCLFATTAASSITAANIVEPGNVVDFENTVSANDIKPDECVGISVDVIVTGSPVITGPNTPALILANSGTTDITGGSQSDCIVGSSATTFIDGGGGIDVCIGSMSVVFANCESEIRV